MFVGRLLQSSVSWFGKILCSDVGKYVIFQSVTARPLVDVVSQYPAYDTFTKSVELEAEQAVKRLRNHPSVVILGGHTSYTVVVSNILKLLLCM